MRLCWVVILAVERPVTCPPIRRASKTTTDFPASHNESAVVSPTIPAPTITTSQSRDPDRLAKRVWGALATQQHSAVPGRSGMSFLLGGVAAGPRRTRLRLGHARLKPYGPFLGQA